ncbi:PH domain-containing protein [Colletotrichum higginsianum IMI 349063]|uniref:PH domain-containing protein n=3 Tax=Colletotrichum higginsianum TaxID=80884 RepID=A0A1B7YU33_COLHI|nr:PH domain-containing protein [Colletotrichum higginsianum IMI 349063]OBR15541.1 PH domain-containing protein [Colletotrichum higginsianum IMI 349063]TID03742.1 Protein pob1 [Colletotrichum higginsianum]
MNYTQEYAMGERRLRHEMREKPTMRDTFFGIKAEPQRPTSVATEFMDMEWDDEVLSEFEDNSPRISVNSSGGQPSITTLSSYDEVSTPRSSRGRMMYAAEIESPSKNIEGPSGPHLFRASTSSYFDEAVLTLSPITPKTARPFDEPFRHIRPQQPPMPQSRHQSGPFQFTYEEFESRELVSWTPEMVAQSMLNAGIELSVAGRFVENDINGPILITLKFEDLKELDIPSFGMRTRVWNQIQVLRDSRPSSPRAPTPIQDEPSREVKKETHEVRAAERQTDDCGLKRRKSSRRRPKNPSYDDIITPMESVSIVGIEQVVPKPHQCPKGENCSRYKKQQRLIEAFKKEHPFVDLDTEQVVITGNPGNPQTARALDPNQILRPVSDAVPSVVASSDVLGPGNATPLQYLQEAALRNVVARDPQDNVRQFLDFQKHEDSTVPPTPPFEMAFPTMKAQPEGLRHLPKLSIPGKQAPRASPLRASTAPPPSQHESLPTPPQHQQGFVPYHMDRAEAMSPDLQSPVNLYRFGTPFSEMDVPVTAVPMDRVARDVSQSVPPEMNYRPGTVKQQQPPLSRTQSRSSARRPSFPVLPALDENNTTPIARTSPRQTFPRTSVRPQQQQQQQQQPLQAPPRVNYPWSPIERTKPFEQAIPPISHLAGALPVKQAVEAAQQDGVTFQGPMKKRKTKMLRHEWNDTFCTLKGTRLAVHKDAKTVDRTLEYVDVDDYAIACSSLASQSKLSAAFKAVQFSSHSREKSDPVAAFSFQLIPQDKDKEAAKLRKRGSALHGFGHHHSLSSSSIPAEGVNGTGKTHHFAVKSRDDRIDWMRELMLAKALKQKGDGFEVSVNGNMI